MKSIATHNAPAAIGPYSQAVLMNDTLFVSGHDEAIEIANRIGYQIGRASCRERV